jgi:hypothetical protein
MRETDSVVVAPFRGDLHLHGDCFFKNRLVHVILNVCSIAASIAALMQTLSICRAFASRIVSTDVRCELAEIAKAGCFRIVVLVQESRTIGRSGTLNAEREAGERIDSLKGVEFHAN